MSDSKLNKIRIRIDNIDDKIVRLFEERLRLVDDIVEEKNSIGIAIKDSKREAEILKRYKEKDDFQFIEMLYKSIFEISTLREEKNLKNNKG